MASTPFSSGVQTLQPLTHEWTGLGLSSCCRGPPCPSTSAGQAALGIHLSRAPFLHLSVSSPSCIQPCSPHPFFPQPYSLWLPPPHFLLEAAVLPSHPGSRHPQALGSGHGDLCLKSCIPFTWWQHLALLLLCPLPQGLSPSPQLIPSTRSSSCLVCSLGHCYPWSSHCIQSPHSSQQISFLKAGLLCVPPTPTAVLHCPE